MRRDLLVAVEAGDIAGGQFVDLVAKRQLEPAVEEITDDSSPGMGVAGTPSPADSRSLIVFGSASGNTFA